MTTGSGPNVLSLDRIASTFGEAGFLCYLVGGAIRDFLLRKPTHDYDLATDATPKQVMGLFRRVIPTGIKHGTVTVLFAGESYEITTFRTDGEYLDGRRPKDIQFVEGILPDLARRDFTINSIAFDLLKKEFLDPNDGRGDLKKKVIKAIGDPITRFTEDGLRPMRALRFVSQLGFSLDEETFNAIKKSIHVAKLVSAERVSGEFVKLVTGPYALRALVLMRDSGLMEALLPDLYACSCVECSDTASGSNLLMHQICAAARAPLDNAAVRLAALFHDVGKTVSAETENHHEPGAKLMTKIGRELKMPNAHVDKIARLVRHHMFEAVESGSDADVRRFIAAVGPETLSDLFALRRATRPGDPSTDLMEGRVAEALASHPPLYVSDLAVTGNDLAAEGYAKGPVMGALLNRLLNYVLDDPAVNTRESLLRLAKESVVTSS